MKRWHFGFSLSMVLAALLVAPLKAAATPTQPLIISATTDFTPTSNSEAAVRTTTRAAIGADEWVEQGTILLRVGEFDAALVAFDRALQLNPSSASGWLHRGRALSALEQNQAALESVQWALILDPKLSEARHLLSSLQAVLVAQ